MAQAAEEPTPFAFQPNFGQTGGTSTPFVNPGAQTVEETALRGRKF